MKIPESATPEWFQEQADKGTFDAVEWVRWIRAKAQDLYERDPKAFWAQMDQTYEDHMKEYGPDVLATDLELNDTKKRAAA